MFLCREDADKNSTSRTSSGRPRQQQKKESLESADNKSMAPDGGYSNHSSFLARVRVNSNPCVMTDNSAEAELWVIGVDSNTLST